MNILIDLGHPAHIHLFKNFIKGSSPKNSLIVTTRNVPILKELLSLYKIPFITLSKKKDGLIRKIFAQLALNIKLYNIARENKIDFAIGSTPTIIHICKLLKAKSVLLDDDDDVVEPLIVKYVHPFCDVLLSPDVLKGKRKLKKTIYYPGYHELAYLHPNRFTLDPSVLTEVGLGNGERYFIMRFNVFKAHHDLGVKGLSLDQKLELISILKPLGKILITTERNIEPELSEYQMKISPEKAHSLLAYATLLIGDSQTMTSEAAVLGVPSLRCNSFAGRISYLEEEEKKYGLTYAFIPEEFDKLKIKLNQLLGMDNIKEEWQRRRQIMLMDKIDVTGFMVWFIENYPKSVQVLKETPDYQYNFK